MDPAQNPPNIQPVTTPPEPIVTAVPPVQPVQPVTPPTQPSIQPPSQPTAQPQPLPQPVTPQTFTATPASSSSNKKILMIVFAIIFFLVILGLIGFWFFSSKKIAPPNSPSPDSNTVNKTEKIAINAETLTEYSVNDLQRMGIVTLPQGFQIQEEYKGIKILKSPKVSYTPEQLNMLHYFIDKTPTKLLSPGPNAIVTYAIGEVETGYMNTLNTIAFASGPYIFFNEDSFKGSIMGIFGGDTSLDQALISYQHELVHIVQFDAAKKQLTEKLKNNPDPQSQVSWQEESLNSPLMTQFASLFGWEKSKNEYEETTYNLKNPDTAVTTEYGKTNIQEDMAETISGIIMVKDYEFSPERKKWALEFLGVSYESLKPGKFPTSAEILPASNSFSEYNYDKGNEFKTKYPFTNVQVFVNQKANTLEEVKNFYTTELSARGWTGSFDSKIATNDYNVEIYKGNFTGNKRDLYLELRSYDNATGYTEKPTGTVVNILSGYSF